MNNTKPIKVVRIAKGLGVRLPSAIVSGLNVLRGEFVTCTVVNVRTLVLERVHVVPRDEEAPQRDRSVPVVKIK